VTIDAYLADDQSSWAVGAGWDAAIATDVSTIGVPSVADHCIAVGAMPDHVADKAAPWFAMSYYDYDVPSTFVETQRQARAYSPRGPRIDGVQKPDVLAPDNPWAAAPHTTLDTYKFPYASFAVFGGTSGASPHVTGVAALLAQSGVHGDAARDAIRKGATKVDDTAKLPNGDDGYGALDAAGAFGLAASAAVTPTISVKLDPATPVAGASATLTPTVAGGDGLEVKWDDDYDGTWDVGYAKPAARAVTLDHVGVRSFKVRVRNASGHFSEALAVVTFGAPPAAPGGEASGCGCETAGRTRLAGGAATLGGALALGALARVRRRRR
jgi:subtilisin family serine protease